MAHKTGCAVSARVIGCAVSLLIAGCTTAPPVTPSASHIAADRTGTPPPAGSIPNPVDLPVALPKPKPAPRLETYSVVVNNVKVQELLFALARDAKINVDVHPGLSGTVTLNAIDQTLPQLLARIAKQVDMRYELDGPNLVVMPDSPFLRTYRVDYVNLSRDTSGSVSINTQITSASTAAGTSTATGGSAIGGSNNSTTEVRNTGRNHFWESLEKNIKDILRETDKILPEGSSETVIESEDFQTTTGTGAQTTSRGRNNHNNNQSSIAGSPSPASVQASGTQIVRRATFREAASVIVNAETGVVTVRATSRQHEKIQEFVDNVMNSAKRQVLIEATIAEVALSKNYQQGIDWQALSRGGKGFSFSQAGTNVLREERLQLLNADGTSTGTLVNPSRLSNVIQVPGGNLPSGVTDSLIVMAYRSANFAASVKLLESFGTVKVLSSPKLSVLNNQTAILKVVDNIVYFEIKADTTANANNTLTTITTTPRSVSVGLVMSVTPQVSESDSVLLNVRPTISRVTGFVSDPNPNIPSSIGNRVPQIQTREMESMLRVTDGEIAVLGGLMQDDIDYKTDAVPGISRIPLLGNMFTYRNDTNTKTELVIFLRPIVIREPSLDGDYRSYRDRLPTADYFKNNPNPPLPQWELGTK
jgi:MSHA biogenesis protein MshL